MANGPKGEKRPADANQRAVMVARIATGEIEDMTTDDGKNAAVVAAGRAYIPMLIVLYPAQLRGAFDQRH